MNERVEKFARECGAWNQVYGNRNFMIDEHFDIEQFAQLIVKECAKRSEDLGQPELGKGLMKHFGVEL
jgi:hypothetical protein